MPELKQWAYKWNPFIMMFLQMIDRKNGSFIHLPFDVDVMEQPSKTMTIFVLMQEIYMKTISESIKRK